MKVNISIFSFDFKRNSIPFHLFYSGRLMMRKLSLYNCASTIIARIVVGKIYYALRERTIVVKILSLPCTNLSVQL